LIATLFDVVFSVALALIFARGLGYLLYRLKQPAVIGEILAGVILGAVGLTIFYGQTITFIGVTLDLPRLVYDSKEFELLADLGILFLLFISGLETSISRFKKMGKTSSFAAAGGVILPLLLGIITGLYFHFSLQESIAIGAILVATSVGVTVRTLMDLHVLDTNVGVTILGSAVIDDILGIILLAFAFGIESPLNVGLKVVIFFLLFLYLGLKIIDKLLLLGEKIHLPKAFLSITLAIFLIYSFFADQAGIAGIIGAFVAGVIIGKSARSRKISDDVKTLGYGFFVPLFFVWIGTRLDLSIFYSIGGLAVTVIIISIFGKIGGCGLGALLSGMNSKESLQVGIGMIPRMELALIIATTAISQNILTGTAADQLLAITILVTTVTTVITPLLIKAVFKS
jgi:Kef-type K+ transport system membrane component KefB